MMKQVSFSLTVLVLSLGLVGNAGAWTRNGTASGPRGTASVNAWGSCSGLTCQRSVSRTGPEGRSVHRNGSASCNGSGSCSGSRTTTGPNGGTVVRQGSVQRY